MGVKVSDRQGHLEFLERRYKEALNDRGRIEDVSNHVGEYKALISDLQENYFGRFRNDRLDEALVTIRARIDSAFADPSLIATPKHACMKASSTEMTQIEQIDAMPRLCPSEIGEGPDFWRRHTSYVQLRDPLRTAPEILSVLFDPALIAVVQEYLGGRPQLNFVKAQRTWANEAPEIDTQLWHVDLDARKLMKVFIFLHDVDEARGGTRFVRGSHLFDGPLDYQYQDRWSDQQIFDLFGVDAVASAESHFGELFLMDTNLIHRGSRPEELDRTVVIANFGLHEETVSGGTMLVSESTLVDLSDWQMKLLPEPNPE